MQHQEPMHKERMLVMITANTISTMGINMIRTTITITAIAVALQIINNNNRHLKHLHHRHHRHPLVVMILINNHTMPCHHHRHLHHRNRSPKKFIRSLSSSSSIKYCCGYFSFYDRTKRVSAHVLRSGSPVTYTYKQPGTFCMTKLTHLID